MLKKSLEKGLQAETEVIAVSRSTCSNDNDKVCCKFLQSHFKDEKDHIYCDREIQFSILSNCFVYGHMQAFHHAIENCTAQDFQEGKPTPLWLLVNAGQGETVRKLLQKFGKSNDFEKKAPDGTKPLVQAICQGHKDIFWDLCKVIPKEDVCLELAKFGKHLQLRQFLKGFPPEKSHQLLINALISENYDTLKLVIDSFGTKLVSKEFLERAEKCHSIKIIQLLKSSGIMKNLSLTAGMVCSFNRSPLSQNPLDFH